MNCLVTKGKYLTLTFVVSQSKGILHRSEWYVRTLGLKHTILRIGEPWWWEREAMRSHLEALHSLRGQWRRIPSNQVVSWHRHGWKCSMWSCLRSHSVNAGSVQASWKTQQKPTNSLSERQLCRRLAESCIWGWTAWEGGPERDLLAYSSVRDLQDRDSCGDRSFQFEYLPTTFYSGVMGGSCTDINGFQLEMYTCFQFYLSYAGALCNKNSLVILIKKHIILG